MLLADLAAKIKVKRSRLPAFPQLPALPLLLLAPPSLSSFLPLSRSPLHSFRRGREVIVSRPTQREEGSKPEIVT